LTARWPDTVAAPTLFTTRLTLTPLAVADAVDMVKVLADPGIYEFTGGEPDSLEALTQRYARQVVGRSPDRSQLWFNWIIRSSATMTPLGYVQATVAASTSNAEVAWVLAPQHQGQGFATEAARAMISWLRSAGCGEFVAHVNPHHGASARVAEQLGFEPTDVVVDGEIRWTSSG
jgi:RimJ/RimL family protein N-acetyltransferase